MDFEWDENKRRLTIVKHGLDFARVVKIWSGFVIDPYKWRDVGEERRAVALGRIAGDEMLIAVVYTDRSSVRRLISARKARHDERADYKTELERCRRE